MHTNKIDKYLQAEGLVLLECWAREGLGAEEIAGRCGVSVRTLRRWRQEHPRLREALDRGAALADAQVEDALLRRCLGYDYTEDRVEFSEKGEKHTQVRKHVPGDTAAQLIWLKNRRPDRWRDKPPAVGDMFQEEAHRALVHAILGDGSR